METFSLQTVKTLYYESITAKHAEIIKKVQNIIKNAAENRWSTATLKSIDKDLAYRLKEHFQNLGFSVTILQSSDNFDWRDLKISGWNNEENKKEI
jgi:hypothetical protein